MTVIRQSNRQRELRDISNALTTLEGASGGGVSVVFAKGSATSSVANTTANVTWNTPTITDASVTVSSADITINEDAVYLFDVTVRTTNNNRTELIIHTEIDTGGGYTEDTDLITSDYVSRDTDQNTGAVSLHIALDLTDGDKVRFVAEGDCYGTSTLMTAGTHLRVVKA